MSEYLLLNIIIIIFPFLLSFEKKIQYYKKLPALFVSIILIGGIYIVWDSIAASRGDWAFNPEYILGFTIFKLPIEEILFFVTVPYSAVFLYETAKLYLHETKIDINKRLIPAIIVILISLAVIFREKYYTCTVLLFTALFLIISMFSKYPVFKSRIYIIWILFMFVPFFVVNYVLTSLPIVTYSLGAIVGFRILTIPVEDFFYSFSMLSLYLLVYVRVKEKWLKKR